MTELEVACACMNPRFRTPLQGFLRLYQFKTKISQYLIEAGKDFCKNPNLTPELVQEALITKGFNGTEASAAVRFYTTANKYAEEGNSNYTIFIESCANFMRKALVADMLDTYTYQSHVISVDEAQNNFIDSMRKLPTTVSSSPFMDFKYVDLLKLLGSEEELKVIPSYFDFYNRSSAKGGYCKGHLIGVNAPPGVGKTIFLLQEALNLLKQGQKVIWVALGDMTYADLVSRLLSLYIKKDFFELSRSYEESLKTAGEEFKKLLSNLRALAIPAHSITAQELVDQLLLENTEEKFDVFVIDYDDNLLMETESMYENGRQTFACFAKLTRNPGDFKLGFIASQVKQQYWSTEELPENCTASSSGKQAVLDAQININRNKDNSTIGTMLVAKQRRGILTKDKFKFTRDGGLNPIEYSEYQDILYGI